MHIKTSIGLLVFKNKFKVTFNSFSGPFANYASEIYSFRVVMFVGGFFGFLGLFLSAFVSRMELWILTYGVFSGMHFKVSIVMYVVYVALACRLLVLIQNRK